METLREWVRGVSITGGVDILLMAAFIYLGLVWLRRSQSAKVLQGILTTGLLYLLARQFDLFLTAAVFEAFFTVAVIAMVVIFRDELRRLFERVARWRPGSGLGRTQPQEQLPPAVDILTRTLFDLSRDRVGALVVLRGVESIESHVEGGVPLDGALSEALLKSLFDAHSIGHDGAVVIEQGLVTRFGCHLPLSTSFDKLSSHGTRHAAALGLAERTDALCLVVSEERGTVTAARDGVPRVLSKPEDLARLLTAFLVGAPQAARPLRDLVWKDYPTKALALGISVLLWLVLVQGAKNATQRVSVPVEVANVPVGHYVQAIEPPEVTLTFSGPRRSFLGRRSATVVLSLSEAHPGGSSQFIHGSDVTFPKDLTLRDIEPARVRVSLEPTNGQPSRP